MTISVILCLLTVVPRTKGYTVNYTDCSAPAAVRSYKANSICHSQPIDPEVQEKHRFTVLQQEEVMAGVVCRVLQRLLARVLVG